MPMPDDDQVELLVAGHAQDTWETYDIDSDLLTPADAWHVELGVMKADLPDYVVAGAPVEIRVGGERVLMGMIDEIKSPVDKHRVSVTLSGRDGAGVLLDCSAALIAYQQLKLSDVIAKLVRPLGVTNIRLDAETDAIHERVNVEPGDTAWAALSHAAEANGLWPWFDPDGTLVVGGPDYSAEPVATLVMNLDGAGNNMVALDEVESIAERYSKVTVLGQMAGSSLMPSRRGIVAVAEDDELKKRGINRPKVVVDHECDSQIVAKDRADKLLRDSRLRSMTLIAEVAGHRTDDGVLWKPGQRVTVKSEPHAINAVYFLMGRRFSLSRRGARMTELRFKEDRMWVPDAHPHKRKHRRGRNAGVIINTWGSDDAP